MVDGQLSYVIAAQTRWIGWAVPEHLEPCGFSVERLNPKPPVPIQRKPDRSSMMEVGRILTPGPRVR
jgi:hypothetical protein